jgi:ATP-dependent DNA helicase RecG
VVKVTFDLEVSSAELEKSSVELEVSSVELEKSSVKTSDEILLLLEQEAYITIPKMAELLGISTRAIEKQLANLKESGKLERIGPNKGGYWRVIPNVHIK